MKTFLSFSGGRLEMRTRASAKCADCGAEYHARVHAYAGLAIALGLLAIILVVIASVLWFTGRAERLWILWAKVAAALIVAVIGFMAAQLHNRLMVPRFYPHGSGREPAYGEIVLECPQCGSPSLAGMDRTTGGSAA